MFRPEESFSRVVDLDIKHVIKLERTFIFIVDVELSCEMEL